MKEMSKKKWQKKEERKGHARGEGEEVGGVKGERRWERPAAPASPRGNGVGGGTHEYQIITPGVFCGCWDEGC